jgi:hypothetical protein
LDAAHESLRRVAERTNQQARRRYDDHRTNHGDQRGSQSLLAAQPVREPLMERVHRDGEDQRPDHQGQEWREDLITEHRQCEDKAGADQHVEQLRCPPSFKNSVWLQGRVHRLSPCASSRAVCTPR